MPSSLIPIPSLAWALWKENELLKNEEKKLNHTHEHYYIESTLISTIHAHMSNMEGKSGIKEEKNIIG
jgi:hypothetical protein